MGYCVQNGSDDGDIAPARISVEQLKQLTSEDGMSVVQKVIDAAINEADSDIDGYAAKRYVVPFSPVPSKVKNLSADLATFNLFKKRAILFGGEIPKAYRDMRDDAANFLKDVSTGKALLDGAVMPTENAKRIGGSFQTGKRVFAPGSVNKL